jgi:ferrous iron transport protein A
VTLDRLEIGVDAKIREVSVQSGVMLRLMEMGLVPGAPVRVEKRAPFGGPMELRVRGYLLSIRLDEAKHLVVEPEHP